MTILVTGAAGFIGSHVALRLLDRGEVVVGLDNLSDYYDVRLKRSRLGLLESRPNYTHVHADLAHRPAMEAMFATHRPRRIVHLAAQAGVRYAASNPHAYVDSNLVGFLHVLEGCRHHGSEHLVFASTSSVYGANTALPYAASQPTDHPLTLYAATKKANEAMAHSYAHLYGIPCTGLRFFTVYGPWGRPDMAFFSVTRDIIEGRPIEVYNHGRHTRDFTYVDDIVTGVVGALDAPARGEPGWSGDSPDPATSRAPYRLFNIGSGRPVGLMRYIELLELSIGRKADIRLLPLQPGDVPDTAADISGASEAIGYQPSTPVEQGVPNFVAWYRSYYGV